VKVLLLVGVTVIAWLASVPAVVAIDGSAHWLAGSVAAVLCLVPAMGTLAMLGLTENRSPVAALGAVLIAPLLRLIVVCVAGGLLWRVVPELRDAPLRFGGWVLAFYLITLVAETVLALPSKKGNAASGEMSGVTSGAGNGGR
jgi:hypothetical protein